jgi:hypothetical protein
MSSAQLKAELSERRGELRRRLLQESGGGFGAFVLCVGIWAASGAHGSFWPIWVLLVTAIALVRGAWRLYGPAPELDALEEELDRRQRRHGRRRELRRGR